MTDYARKLLDELMPGRNLERQAEMHFWDENICKDYLAGFCPKDLFVNTKSDLGMFRVLLKLIY